MPVAKRPGDQNDVLGVQAQLVYKGLIRGAEHLRNLQTVKKYFGAALGLLASRGWAQRIVEVGRGLII